MIGETLKALRKREGVTAKAIAETLDILPDTYRSYETGRREPNLETLKAIADHFEVSTDYLLGRNVPPPEHLTKSEKDLEACILEKYKQLPESYRKKFLQGVMEAVEIQKREQVTQEMVTEERAMQEAANDTEQPTGEEQQVDSAEQEEPTQPIVQEQTTQEATDATEQPTDEAHLITKEQDSTKEEHSQNNSVISLNPITETKMVARDGKNSNVTIKQFNEAYESGTDIDEDYFNQV